ncbi:M23 family metallopeptidase [Paenibacillus abyssi]|uniref:M23ase beta-sheet core domain-containing protein n=1 Tax=Paenibacillus abyssi TaxID=1340531 RepID=A0A917G396_9BACL|nr:M23 family metallopeptidase [Paenibacillus abyssi]GGG20335.1 hypothetical protein GCM10010916_41350 [Paenibacillus abyssi]
MEIKDNIRQRRHERIKKIARQTSGPLSSSNQVESLQERVPSNNLSQHLDQDPEWMWKQQSKPWMGWGRADVPFDEPPRRMFDDGPDWQKVRSELRLKLFIGLMMFASVWGMFQLDMPWAKSGQLFVADALTNEMDFEAAAAWYQNRFAGSPAFIPIFGSKEQTAERVNGIIKLPIVVPVQDGVIVRTFAELLSGVEVAAPSEAEVSAVETGRVLLVSYDEATGETVVIQHANKRVTVYSRLEQADVAQNDWVEAGQVIGKLMPATDERPSLLFFAVKENDRYVDPTGVVPFD